MRKRHRQLTELEVRIAAAGSDLELRTRNLGQANNTQTERAGLKEPISAEERAVEQAGQRLENVRQQERTAGRNLMRCAAGVREPRRKSLKLTGRVTATSHTGRRGTGRRGFANWRAAAVKRKPLTNVDTRPSRAAAAILVTDEVLEVIRGVAKELETVESRLSAAATRIVFDMTRRLCPASKLTVRRCRSSSLPAQAVEPVTIAIPDYGRITIEPAIKDRDKLLGQQRDTKVTLKNALQASGIKTVNEAEDQYTRRQKLLQTAELARQEADCTPRPQTIMTPGRRRFRLYRGFAQNPGPRDGRPRR